MPVPVGAVRNTRGATGPDAHSGPLQPHHMRTPLLAINGSVDVSNRSMNNAQIAEVFESIAGLLEMRGESPFTVRAYRRAAQVIKDLPTELGQMVRDQMDLRELPGVGKAISDKITELVNTGSLRYFERLRAEFPAGILDVMRIPGLGPKTALKAWKELDVTTVAELEQAIQDGRLAALPRMGEKAADNILQNVKLARAKD